MYYVAVQSYEKKSKIMNEKVLLYTLLLLYL